MGTMGMPYGFQSMLKEGYKHLQGVDEAVVKNLEACKQLSQITKTSLGPNGMNKMVINHLGKLFVTNDASIIVQELEVQHPAAKLLVMAAESQQQEIGDATNFVITFGGEVLSNAEGLLRDGLVPSEVADGYAKAAQKALEILETLVIPGSENLDVRNKAAVSDRIKGSISSKQQGHEDLLSALIAEACIEVCPKNAANFNVDNVRVAKITGGGIGDSTVVKGMVLKRSTEGSVKKVADAKVAVFAQGVDTESTEGKGTVLIRSAEELENYSRSEEAKIEGIIKSIHDAGVKLVVSGSAVGEMAMHFMEKYGMMCLRIPSKFELRRFCRSTNSVALLKLQTPQPDELGFAKAVTVEEIGGTMCSVLRQDAALGSVSTVVLRGSSDSFLDDVERAVDDGVNAYKVICKDPRILPGGGATEVEVARRLLEWGRTQTGLEQYSITQFAEALDVVPRTIAENSGLNPVDTVADLHAAHEGPEGKPSLGLDTNTGEPRDLGADLGIYDLFCAKWWALKLAADAAVTILRVDQIIMAKQAGGPKPRAGGGDED